MAEADGIDEDAKNGDEYELDWDCEGREDEVIFGVRTNLGLDFGGRGSKSCVVTCRGGLLIGGDRRGLGSTVSTSGGLVGTGSGRGFELF